MKLTVKETSKKFGNKTALNNISITFENGITGLLGPNGAGKSTLMRILATIDVPTQGEVYLDDINVIKQPAKMRNILGYLPQDFGVYPNMNPVEFLEYMAAMSGLSAKLTKPRIQDLLNVLHLSDVKKKPLGGFSGGMRQRVGIAQALLNDPKVLIVDEPTVGLDPVERIQFRNLLASLTDNRIIILSTHIVTDIESIAPQIAIMKNGTLISLATPEALLSTVEDKVWQIVISPDEIAKFQQRYMVSSSTQRSDGIHIKIVSDEKPALSAEQIVPTLEDAYMYAIYEKEGVIV